MKPKFFVLALGAFFAVAQSPIAFAQNAGPVQAPIDDTTPSTAPQKPAIDSSTTPEAPTAGAVIPGGPTKKAADFTEKEIRALGSGPSFPYSLLENALTRYVDGKSAVNYNKLQLDQDLALFVRAVGFADLGQFPIFTDVSEKGVKSQDRTSELTFWINAYNGLILNRLAQAYPVKSVGSVKNLHTEKVHVVAGKTYSLAEIRDRIGKMDPRALFALTDGTQAGPRAPRSAYRYAGLGTQLNAAVRAFVDDPLRVIAPDRLQGAVFVSPWLQSVDAYFKNPKLKRKWDGVREVLSAYTSTRVSRNFFVTGDYEIKFLPISDNINDVINVIS